MFCPVMLNLEGKFAAVVGGGAVALRKVKYLLQYNCKVKVISLSFAEGFKNIQDNVQCINSEYREDLIEDVDIVIAATSSKDINKRISDFCREHRILCNIADDIKASDFIIPSSIKRGDLVIAVSTSGNSPSLAAKIKKELEEKYTEEYKEYVHLLGEVRRLVLSKCKDAEGKKKILNELTDLSFEELRKRRDYYEDCHWI